MENNPPLTLQENPLQEDDADLAMEAEDQAPLQEVQGQVDDEEDAAMEAEDDDDEDLDEFATRLDNMLVENGEEEEDEGKEGGGRGYRLIEVKQMFLVSFRFVHHSFIGVVCFVHQILLM
ncbi:hypothetical protein COLO4_07085 [Corchorus olitorius]|uniref:Uncharacterized protein n=1 Tax=Corchorus olitorius TaxID=93759 RepID=A0A1R3KKX6_9ROSI|nr:hypothetical protein COLO4_07085 [Corchorus olitorius]